jgi:ATP-dependent helicase HrpB
MTTLHNIESLPVYGNLDAIASMVLSAPVSALSAEPGAGKTTLVPWHLLKTSTETHKKILLLQPRRIAARAAAERIAFLLGESVGKRVGLRTRQETLVSRETRLEVITEGVLVRMVQSDQSLEQYSLIIFDEFHERSLAADLSLALVNDSRLTLRDDLKLLIMSATLHHEELETVFSDVPLLTVPGRVFPVDVSYSQLRKNEKIWDAAARCAVAASDVSRGDVLVFLPGFREIRRTQELLSQKNTAAEVCVLHGQLHPTEQRKVLEVSDHKRIILSTNVAETSLTIPGVDTVVDSGLVRRVQFNPRTAMDHWDTVRISAASAEQRKGRAGRLGPGRAVRLWEESEYLIPFDQPEILQADCAPVVYECLLWGARSVYDLAWITPPPKSSVKQALQLLETLGICSADGIISEKGKALSRYALHPRLAVMMYESELRNESATGAALAAVIEEDDSFKTDDPDIKERVAAVKQYLTGSDRYSYAKRAAEEYKRILSRCSSHKDSASAIDPEHTGRLLSYAFPERMGRKVKQTGAESRWVLASGRGAVLKGALSDAEFIVAADIDGGDSDGRIFSAASIARSDIEKGLSGSVTESVSVVWDGWRAKAATVIRAGLLVLEEKMGGVLSPEIIERAVRDRITKEGIQGFEWSDAAKSLLARCRYIQKKNIEKDFPDFSDDALIAELDTWLMPFARFDGGKIFAEDALYNGLVYRLGHYFSQKIDSIAPQSVTLPSGSVKQYDYESGDVPILAARLQEFFGCIETPMVCGEPVLLHLLSPAGRPMQITRNLETFWDGAYPEIKKELLGRYPKHYWPDNPREAEPTARTKKRR